ncbi:MAG: DUF3817 domain-containing protein [Actinomycetes bacterium]
MPDFADESTTELERKAKALEWVALIEAITYCVLFYFWIIQPSVPGKAIAGFFHGLVWLAFVAMTLMITPEIGWSWPFTIVAVVTGPFGGVLVWWRITRGGVPYRGRAVR